MEASVVETSLWSLPPLSYVLASLGLILLLKILASSRTPVNIPPFPVMPFPVLGHLPYLVKGQRSKLLEWRKTTGDIYSVYIGPQLYVILNGCKLVREGLVTNANSLSDRPKQPHIIGGDSGIVFSNGHLWKEQRTLSINILRSFGMGKSFLSHRISEEVSEFLATLSEAKGKPQEISLLLRVSVSNVICSICIGKRFDYADPVFTSFMCLMEKGGEAFGNVAPAAIWPWLMHIPGNFMNSNTVNDILQDLLTQFCDRFIEQTKRDGEENMPECFISEYLKEKKEQDKKGKPTTLENGNLRWVLLELFLAGSDTTSSTLLWFIAYMLRHPDIQKKIHKEIIDVVGAKRTPEMQDKPKLPLTWAAVMETQRLSSIVPASLPRLSTSEITIQGYTIPAGTAVLPNLDTVMMDDKTWREPLKFEPERFLDGKGVTKPDAFVPYGVGRRMCMGEALANMELFLYVSALIQRFELQPSIPGKPITMRSEARAVCPPEKFKACFLERTS